MEAVGRRTYRSLAREERARATRRAILEAAGRVFPGRGYAGTTMRSIAVEARVSVPTVELYFRGKAGVLKAAIDVAIAGDDEPVAVLDRDWTAAAERAGSVEELLAVVCHVLTAAQERSAGLILAALEACAVDADLAALVGQLVHQRAVTAGWIVERVAAVAGGLRTGLARDEAVDTVWMLMDPAVFVRLTGTRGWSRSRYQAWVARALRHLLTPDPSKETR